MIAKAIAYLANEHIFIFWGGDCLDYIPKHKDELSLIKFIAEYQYINLDDLPYIFSSKEYYKKRVTKLIKENLISRLDHHLILTSRGRIFAKTLGLTCNKPNRDIKYYPRLYYISGLAAFYFNSNFVSFTPSFNIKDKDVLTTSSRRYIGIININGIDYLTYHISKERDKKYISSVIYDIQKESKYRNIIVFIDTDVKIDTLNFTFGYNQVLIVEDTLENRNKLEYINSINWYKILCKIFKNPHLSEYNFCDYIDDKNRYISYFTLFDTEKINRINQFLRENKFKKIEILCSKELYSKLKQEIPRSNYTVLNIENYIDRKKNIYE